MFWNKYPYTDFHELNLDMILRIIKDLHQEWDEFKVINAITFDGVWDITKQYPAWCIVNWNNGQEGYISIKPVPAGVTIDNTDYWVSVVNYTATIADLQNRVVALENNQGDLQNLTTTDKSTLVNAINEVKGDASDNANAIATLSELVETYHNRKFLFISDSYCDAGRGGYDYGLCTSIERLLGLTHDTDSFLYAKGGAGFVGAGQGKTFNDLVEDSYTDLEDIADEITDVLILGGANDADGTSYSDINSAKATCITNIKAKYPNALIHIGVVSGFRSVTQREYLIENVEYVYYYPSDDRRIRFLAGVDIPMKLLWNFDDDVHPNSYGIQAIAQAVAYNFGRGAYLVRRREMTITYDAGITVGDNLRLNFQTEPCGLRICSRVGGAFTGSFSVAYNTGAKILLGTSTDCLCGNYRISNMIVPLQVQLYVSASECYTVGGRYQFEWDSVNQVMEVYLVIPNAPKDLTATTIRINPYNMII